MPFETTDVLGRRVILDDTRWGHIQREHPEVREQVIRSTVEDPQLIATSSKFTASDVYFSLGMDATYPHLYCKVVVDFTDEPGLVLTAMYQKDLQGANIPGGIRYGHRR